MKLIKEDITDYLKPKSDEEIKKSIENLSSSKIMKYVSNSRLDNQTKIDLIQKALDKGYKIKNDYELYLVKNNLNLSIDELVPFMSISLKLKSGYDDKNASPNQLFSAGINKHDNKMLKKAIKNGATNTDINYSEALFIAIDKNDLDLFKQLLKTDIDVNGRGISGNRWDSNVSVLGYAVRENKIEFVKLLLKHPKTLAFLWNNYPLRTAIRNKNWDIVELLINNKNVIYKMDRDEMEKIIKKLLKLIR